MKSNKYYLRTGLFLSFCILSCVGLAQTYTFTSAGVTGLSGPTQGQVNTAYTITNLNGMVTVNTQGIQEWVVPASGIYSIEAYGASGGTHATLSGRGAQISGEMTLTIGTTLYILVGQMGSQFATSNADGGGGGSFITDGTNLLVASGGGGGSSQASHPDQNASLTNAVSSAAAEQFGSTGAGYTTNGVHFSYGTYTTVAQSFINGGLGQAGGQAAGWPGVGYGDGGFGGGGSSCSCSTGGGGGGGGYNGGGGGNYVSNYLTGFGGSSYTIGSATNVTSSVLTGTGDGMVVITALCSPTLITLDLGTLADVNDECSSSPVAPTATNDCGLIINGVPDVTMPIITPGMTLVTWTYDDGQGNVLTQTQNVILTDVTAPVADSANLPDLADMCGVNSITAPTATDNCMGTITGTTTTTFPISTVGASVIIWNFDDGSGNVSTQTQNVLNGAIDNGIQLLGSQLSATALVAAYQWMDCDANYAIIAGEVNQFYDATSTGQYAVEITQGGCIDTSECILVDFTAIEEIDVQNLTVYPNPTSGSFSIDFDGNIDAIVVTDALGRIIELPLNLTTGKIDGSNLASGKYTVSVITANTIYRQDIVVVK